MKAKNYLKQLIYQDIHIANLMDQKEHWKAIALGISAHSDGERVQSSSGSQSKMADAVSRYVDKEREISKSIDDLYEMKCDVIQVIEQLAQQYPIEYDILHKMYVGKVIENEDGTFTTVRMTFKEIADAYKKSYSWATTVHGRALQKVQRILDARETEDKICD